ncbi:Retrovirus-related Pol polyprotein from transposon TNT 1-94 [Vitis vinifera]|uniref:Retrovirus-related Pol polyprotein from transposon TNT 1-94 n=1 Tax=Vitis vinifera TaxID=29760 RepID=A0A438CP50_VITVI|nr:Retrovirus-related Pol polyprotein from transposon TNT 1-94 [Vitis vinifera]
METSYEYGDGGIRKKNKTWELVKLPAGKKPVGCKWVYTVKYRADGSIERYKTRLVAKGYTQTYGIDYQETFAPIAKMNTVRVLLSLAAKYNWDLQQFDVKNVFLHGELEEEIYMEVSLGYDNNLAAHIKYVIDLLKEAGKTACKPASTLIDPNLRLGEAEKNAIVDKEMYQRLSKGSSSASNLSSVTISQRDIRRSTSRYCTFLRGNLVTWRSKKQNVVARSSAETEFRAMAQGVCELLWLKIALEDLKIK